MIKLHDLKLIEAANFSVQFEQSKTAVGTGQFTLDYGDVSVEGGGKLSTDNSKSLVIIDATPTMLGSAEKSEDSEYYFRLKINLRLVYAYDSKLEMSPKFLNENQWFFASQIMLFFKLFSQDVFKNSTISEIKIPT